jgi:phosphoribosylaminoimidazolecarboxamide formyltransferase / IMP cyclohydrolase
MRALLSLTDKTGLESFARGLVDQGFELVSSGGTARQIRQVGLDAKDISDITGFPEMLDGRVKTLHPLVHGGLLGDIRLDSHLATMAEAGIQPIRVVAVNLYAFEQTISGPHEFAEAIEAIDIGGPALLRGASKNHANVFVVVDPADYDRVLEGIKSDDPSLRLELAAKAFRYTAYYDSMVARYLTESAGQTPFQEYLTMGYRHLSSFRYGENPHQNGAIYRDPLGQDGLASAKSVWGWEMGYNNWNDADGAWELVADLPVPACAITKHGNPSGAAIGANYAEAFRIARDADPISAFGGVVALNGVLDQDAALAMTEKGNKLDVIIATSITEGALETFKSRKGWGQEVRLLVAPLPPAKAGLTLGTIRGGALVQESDEDPGLEWKTVTDTQPSDEELETMRFLWKIIPHVKSNAIVLGKNGRLLGVGAGQMNRVQSVRLAIGQAGDESKGSCLASDAFFPFPDSIETAHAAGITAIVQPGGSKKDHEVIARANELGISMVFTGVRHFRH